MVRRAGEARMYTVPSTRASIRRLAKSASSDRNGGACTTLPSTSIPDVIPPAPIGKGTLTRSLRWAASEPRNHVSVC